MAAKPTAENVNHPGLMDIDMTLLFTVFLYFTVGYGYMPPVFAFGGIFDTMQLLIPSGQ